MSTKECPSCGTIVPESAARCKECFHDFTEDEPQSRSSSGILMVLGAFAAMAVVGSGVLWYITSTPTEERILVDQDTRSVVWTRKYRSGIETDRLRFDDVIRLEYVLKATGHYEIAAVTAEGDRKVIQEDDRPLRAEANKYKDLMETDLKEIDNTSGFHKLGEE